ncbi:MAG: LysR family transcriptional regulator [Phenylobacterium sp.]|uniref:LysR family transcriptional regulator n=1 Tax=Phenylobacterium sp. TaxID=1871053 RepID=UPI0025D98AD3|nr:LysR family transcriptional regulator [Phenylobacterium sp.]MBI1200132.1 LysR family transcriptional regulator [Phenylobacterium sp.]
MTLEQLRIFVAVAERLHMTRAAEALHLTQSAVSAAVAALEARHGVRLFDRIGRGLALTEAGRVFLPEATAVLLRAQVAEQALSDLSVLKRGTLTLAASQTISTYWLPGRVARFAEAYPGVALKFQAGNTAEVAAAVAEGRAELGFVEGEVDNWALLRRPVGGDRVALYVAPDHPLAGRTGLAPGDLADARFVLRETGSGTRAWFERAMGEHGLAIEALRVFLELPSNEAVLSAAAEGGLVAAVSDLAAAPLVAVGRLARLDLDLGARRFEVLTHKERRTSAAARAFLDLAAPVSPVRPGPRSS